ncbi:hypothetical protein [[Mycoplasma] collis]|uniref:hypothetical protein n=1 Tax=[Mycoplasma] collis TaxID=2127 RepID=UPI00051B375D|nr:hypothetical protein [[Mycoplasma] collis]
MPAKGSPASAILLIILIIYLVKRAKKKKLIKKEISRIINNNLSVTEIKKSKFKSEFRFKWNNSIYLAGTYKFHFYNKQSKNTQIKKINSLDGNFDFSFLRSGQYEIDEIYFYKHQLKIDNLLEFEINHTN